MATVKKSRLNYEEIIVGSLLFAGLGFIIFRAYQGSSVAAAASIDPNATPQSAVSSYNGMPYIWAGQYGGSIPAGLPSSSTVPGATSLVIPPETPITYPPVSAPFAPQSLFNNPPASSSGCGCESGQNDPLAQSGLNNGTVYSPPNPIPQPLQIQQKPAAIPQPSPMVKNQAKGGPIGLLLNGYTMP